MIEVLLYCFCSYIVVCGLIAFCTMEKQEDWIELQLDELKK